MLALFDVLGFSDWLERTSLKEIVTIYERLLERAVNRDEEPSLGAVRVDGGRVFTVYNFKARTVYFSDTIIVWVPMVQTFVWSFINTCSELICDALDIGILLRGAVTQGIAVMHRPTGIYIGKPLVNAVLLERAQDWCGVTLHHSATWPPFLAEIHPTQILEFDAHLKPGSESLASPIVIDWPRKWRETRTTSASMEVQKLNRDPRFTKYYDNTVKFIDFSAANEDWHTKQDAASKNRKLRMVRGENASH